MEIFSLSLSFPLEGISPDSEEEGKGAFRSSVSVQLRRIKKKGEALMCSDAVVGWTKGMGRDTEEGGRMACVQILRKREGI